MLQGGSDFPLILIHNHSSTKETDRYTHKQLINRDILTIPQQTITACDYHMNTLIVNSGIE